MWDSNLPGHIKLSFCLASVESVLYDCKTWTLKPTLQKSLDASYTITLYVVLNVNQNKHVPNKHLYRGLSELSEKVASRRMKLAGHCHRHQRSQAASWCSGSQHRAAMKRPSNTNICGCSEGEEILQNCQETVSKDGCRPLSSWTQTVQTPPIWKAIAYRALSAKTIFHE